LWSRYAQEEEGGEGKMGAWYREKAQKKESNAALVEENRSNIIFGGIERRGGKRRKGGDNGKGHETTKKMKRGKKLLNKGRGKKDGKALNKSRVESSPEEDYGGKRWGVGPTLPTESAKVC